MRKIIFAGLIASLALTAACNRQPQYQYRQVAPAQVVQSGSDCDADDRYEHDTDCGYSKRQHKKRMAFLKSRGYKNGGYSYKKPKRSFLSKKSSYKYNSSRRKHRR